MKLILMHADTPYRVYTEGRALVDKELHVHTSALSSFEVCEVTFAFWSHHKLSDEEAWERYLKMKEAWELVLREHPLPSRRHYYSIEDGRLICGRYQRIERLYADGIRMLAPMWAGCNRLGGGYDTPCGLTPEGMDTLSAALALGIRPDLSHASPVAARELLHLGEMAGVPLLASHTNAYTVCPHPRNLPDDILSCLIESGGLIGICLVPQHLGDREDALLRHIQHILELGGEDALAIGGDLDGTDILYGGYCHAGDLLSLEGELQKAFGREITDKILWQNAKRYLATLPK